MLPSLRQYRKWSLLSKYSFWGFVITIAVSAWPVFSWFVSVPENAILAFNYGTSEMTIYGGPGDSPDFPVIIRGTRSHEAGIQAEYYWIKRHFPGYRSTGQAVFESPEPGSKSKPTRIHRAATGEIVEMQAVQPLPPRQYDVVHIRSWYGRNRDVYFDVTPYFGKGDEPRVGGPGPFEALQDTMKKFKKPE